MAINLADNIRIGQQKPLDDKYYNTLSPYTSVLSANTLLLTPIRYRGLTVNINGVEYWYKNGIADGDLVIKAVGPTSIGLTMPPAFNVANSPLTSDGILAVTALGTAAQYIRGDGQLAAMPSGGGRGSSVNYYLNGSIAASVATYKQLSNTAIIGGGTDFSLTGNGLITQFLTDVGNPNRIEIPGGAWNFEMWFSMSSSGGTPKFYVELLKYNGTTFTTIANSSAVPETITGGTSIDLYLTSLAVPTTTLLSTDRLAIRVYIVNNSGGRTATLHTEDNHLCEIITTFSGGVTSLNGLTANTQYLATGITGTDFNINSTGETHTFNLPIASVVNTGKLSSTDWTIFNNKQNALGFTPVRSFFSGTNGVLVANTLTITPTFTRLIPANTFLANDVVELLFRAFTIDITKTSPTALYIYINTTNSLSSGSPIQTAFFQTTSRTMQMTRTLAIKGATTRVTTVTGNASADSTLTGTSSLLTIDWSVDQYFIFAIGNTVAAPTENLTGDCFRIIKN